MELLAATLRLASALGAPLLLGAGVLSGLGIRARTDRIAYLGWAWASGALVTGLVLLGWASVGAPLSARAIVPFLVAVALCCLGLARVRRGPPLEPHARPADDPRERLLFGLALAVLLLVACDRSLTAALQPVLRTDEAMIWAAKAKAIFSAGGLDERYAETADYVLHADYPALNPLLQILVFAHAGEIVHFAGRAPIQVAQLALLLVLASALTRRIRPALALLVLVPCAALAGAPTGDLLATAYSDGMVALGVAIAVDAWLRWEEDGERAWIALASIGLAFATFAKNEGLFFAGIFVAAVVVSRLTRAGRPFGSTWFARARAALPLALAFTPFALTRASNARFGFEGDLTGTANAAGAPIWETIPDQLADRGGLVVGYVTREVLLDPGNSRLLFALAALVALAYPARVARGKLLVPALLFGLAAVGYGLVFVGSPHHLGRPEAAKWWHLDTACVRVYAQMLPAVGVWLAAAAGELVTPAGSARRSGAASSRSSSG